MITLQLTAHSEKLAPSGAIPAYQEQPPERPALLYHQLRTYEALVAAPLVMNMYPTGTGKTQAALLRLLHPDQQGKNALIIAPTNALIDQHAADATDFVTRNVLDYQVITVDAARLRPLLQAAAAEPGALANPRRGAVLQELMQNYLKFQEQLNLPPDAERQPFIMVTNPDIFYLALFFQYSGNDQRNLFDRFISRFHYLVIDEFHYYDNKQFANFLFFFALWKKWEYLKERRICLLSATPRANVLAYLDRLFGAGEWARVAPDNELPESRLVPHDASARAAGAEDCGRRYRVVGARRAGDGRGVAGCRAGHRDH